MSGRASSNAAEIQAATVAIQLAQRSRIRALCIRTDSEFLLNSVLFWMENWKKNGWIKSDGYPVENREDFKKLDGVMTSYNIRLKWEKVQAHSGNYGNTAADRLARDGAKNY